MDEGDHDAGDRDVRPGLPPSLSPHATHSGTDGSGRVRIELDRSARDVTVVLEDGWRRDVGTAGLPAAVLQAFSAATIARLSTWATAPTTEPPHSPARPLRSRADPPSLDSLARAWRDLREFRLRLATLATAAETVSSPGGPAVVTVAGGQVVGVDLDPDWLRTAGSRDIERHVGHALRAALDLVAAMPERALEGCPDLATLLTGTSFSTAP